LKIETVCFSEMLAFAYEYTRHQNPEQHRHHHSWQNLQYLYKMYLLMFVLKAVVFYLFTEPQPSC